MKIKKWRSLIVLSRTLRTTRSYARRALGLWLCQSPKQQRSGSLRDGAHDAQPYPQGFTLSQKVTLALILPLVFGYCSDVQPSASSSEYTPARQQLIGQKSPTPSQQKSPQQQKKRFHFILPNEGAPGKRVGAATRDSCTIDDKHFLTALVPGTNIGLTIAVHPTFWFYIPYPPNSKTPVDFVLTDAQNKQIYKQTFQLIGTPGVIGITLPANAPALEVDQKYDWNLSFTCNPNNTSEAVSVNGRIKRVKPSSEMTNQLQGSSVGDSESPLDIEIKRVLNYTRCWGLYL